MKKFNKITEVGMSKINGGGILGVIGAVGAGIVGTGLGAGLGVIQNTKGN